jgi:RNA polymerase sigma-70 factor, ECF subfamily
MANAFGLTWEAMDGLTSSAPGADAVADLVRRVRGGDREAFAALTRLYQKRIFALAYGFARDKEDALDLVQDTFLRLHQKIGTYKPGRPFEAWLFQIARNLCIDHYRRRTVKRREHESGRTVEDLDPPDAGAGAGERSRDLKDVLTRCIDRLAERQRTVFILRHYDELKEEDIAAALGISLGTVKSLHFKAVRNLRALMAPHMGWDT